MNELEKLIKNSQLVINYFGFWPTFHDSEIKKITLDRDGTTALIEIYCYVVSEEIEGGAYKKEKECTIFLKLSAIKSMVINDFNNQNVIDGLYFKKIDDGITLVIDSSFGVSGEFLFSEAEIKELVKLT